LLFSFGWVADSPGIMEKFHAARRNTFIARAYYQAMSDGTASIRNAGVAQGRG
jgi:hypothetical protein